MNTTTTTTRSGDWQSRVAEAGQRALTFGGPEDATEPEEVQRRTALQLGNQIRYERAQLKRELKSGACRLVDALEHRSAARAPVSELLGSMDRVGPSRVRSLAKRARVDERTPCGELDEHARPRLQLVIDRAQARSQSKAAVRARERARERREREHRREMAADALGLAV